MYRGVVVEMKINKTILVPPIKILKSVEHIILHKFNLKLAQFVHSKKDDFVKFSHIVFIMLSWQLHSE